MFASVRRDRSSSETTPVDVAPLIDVVFILLIFFLVTATFLNETGIKVQRPEAAHSISLPPAALRVSVTAEGSLYAEGGPLDFHQLPALVREFLAEDANGTVVLIPEASLDSGTLVRVMDAARSGGAEQLAVATAPPGKAP